MKLELSKQEYRQLLEMVYLGNWVIGANETELPPAKIPYAKLEQKVFALAKAAGCADLVVYVPEHHAHFPTRKLEEDSPAARFLAEFEDETFWDALSDRLAERDFAEQVGGWDNFDKVPVEQRALQLLDRADTYNAEFEKSGLDNLRLVGRG